MRTQFFAAVTLALMLLAGCGDGDGSAKPPAQDRGTVAAPEEAVNEGAQRQGAARASDSDPQIEQLIDKLFDVSEPGFGYSAYFSGSEFLPYEDTEEMRTLVLGATRRARSDTLRQIVERGVAAVPQLLAHLDDERKINMEPMSGMMWMDFRDEYDFNRRTRKQAPEGVNRGTFDFEQQHPKQHAITVGDLCFVALGQIVNRGFSATRYQPSGGLVVSSPTYSATLRKVILADWSGLTKERHRQSLTEDFTTPDHEYRRTGAYLRLAFYYPKTVEQLVLNELAKPTFESERARLIRTLTHDRSRKIGDAVKQQFLQSPDDDYFAPACLRCLANRGYGEFLIEQLNKIDAADTKANHLHEKYIESISTSEDEAVRDKLREILRTTANVDYFVAALPAVDGADPPLLQSARRILDGLPADTRQGRELLEMIGQRFPNQARSIYKDFLRPGSARRADTMCVVLWYGDPLSIELLAPLLDDKRPLEGFTVPMRVCDRAAQAISNTTEEITFDSDWSTAMKDKQIVKLKEYCEREAPLKPAA